MTDNETDKDNLAGLRALSGPDRQKMLNFCKMLVQRLLATNREISERAEKLSTFCKEGCCHCCHHLYEITLAEATAISFYLLEQPATLKQFLEQKVENEKQFGNRSSIIAEHGQRLEQRLDYFKRKIPCDFLVEGRCIIYPVRPLICSSYLGFAPGRVCSFEPKGYIPIEIRALYQPALYWFQIQSKAQYKERDELTLDWLQMIYDNVTTGALAG